MYGFISVGGVLQAIPAEPGHTLVSCGGFIFAAHKPRTSDEHDAVRRALRDRLPAPPRPEIRRLTDADAVALMSAKIAERTRACGAVERADFLQAGIPDHLITANLDAAFARARRLEPKLDAMAATP